VTIAVPNLTRRGFTFGIGAVAGGLVFGVLPLSAEKRTKISLPNRN
jgi:hypothetical protein